MQRNLLALASLTVLSSCAPDVGPAPPRAPRDAGPTDAGPVDTGPPDAPDAGIDAGPWRHVDPFFVEVRPTALQVRAGGSVALAVLVAREPGFETPVDVDVFGLPPGTAAASVTVGPSEEAVALRIDAEQGAETGGPRAFSLSAAADGVRQNLRITIEVVP